MTFIQRTHTYKRHCCLGRRDRRTPHLEYGRGETTREDDKEETRWEDGRGEVRWDYGRREVRWESGRAEMRWEDYRVEVRQEDDRGEASREYARGEMGREDDTGDRRWDIDRGEVRLEVDRARGRRQESATGVMRWEDVGGVGQEYCRGEVRREDVRGEMRREDVRGEMRRKDGRREMMRREDRREARLEDEKGRGRNYRDCLQEAECLSVPLKSKRKSHQSENFNESRQKMSKAVCKFYLKGKCAKGDRCKYRHGGVPSRKKKPCKYDAQGSCDEGERCIYIHDILDRRNVAHEMPRRFSHSEGTTAKIIGLLQGMLDAPLDLGANPDNEAMGDGMLDEPSSSSFTEPETAVSPSRFEHKAYPLRPLKKERKHWERDNLGNRVKANELEHADYPSGFNDRSTSDIDLNPHCDMKKAGAIAVKKEYVEDTHVDMSEPAFLDDFNSPSPSLCSDAGVHNSHGAYGAETGKPCPFPRMCMKRGSKRGKATHHVWAQEMGFSHRGQGRGWHNPGRGRSTMRRGRGRGPEGRGMWRGGRGRAAGRGWETDYVVQLRRYKEEQEATVAAPFIQKVQNRRGGCGTSQSKTAEHLSVNNKKLKKRKRNAMKTFEPKLKKQRVVCSFYMEGRCNKGDLCNFSHDAEPLKKKEPCKFYAGGSCGKGERCLYMHDDFPCKFFHTRTNCYQGDLCRFSHQPLTDETKLILQKVLNVPENAEDLNDPGTANGVMHSMDNEVSFGLDHFETLPHQMVFFQRSQSDESKDGVLSPQSNSASSPKSSASSIVEQCAARHKSITRLQPKIEAQTIKWPSNLKLSQERVKTEVNVSSLAVSFSQLPPVTGLPAERTVRTVSILREEPVMIPLDSCAQYNFHDPRLERLSPSCGVSTPPTFPKPAFAVGFVLDPEVSSSQVINDSDTSGAFLGSEMWDRAPCRVMPMSMTQALDFVPLVLNEGPLTSDKMFANTSQYWGAQNPHKDKTVSACDLLMAQTSQAGDSPSPEALSSPPVDAQATDCVVAVHSLPVRPVPSSRNLRSSRRDAITPTLPSNQEGQSDSVSIKEVFKSFDPTASPFC